MTIEVIITLLVLQIGEKGNKCLGVYMLAVRQSDIHITRGDSGYIGLTIYLIDGAHYVREEGDKLVFTAKDNYRSEKI